MLSSKSASPTLPPLPIPLLFSIPIQDSDKFINVCQLENHDPGSVLLWWFSKRGGGFLKKQLLILENLKLISCLFVCLRKHIFWLVRAPLHLKAPNFLKVQSLTQASSLTHACTTTSPNPDRSPPKGAQFRGWTQSLSTWGDCNSQKPVA